MDQRLTLIPPYAVFQFECCLISHILFVWRLIMYDFTEYCLSYTALVSVVQSGAVVTRSNLSQIYTQHCTDSSRTWFILEKHNRHPFLALKGEIWVVCCENLKKIDRVMAVPHCFNPFPVAFGALLWVSLSYDVTSVLMKSSLRTSESVVICLYVLLCLVVTKKCKYGEIKLCEKKKKLIPPWMFWMTSVQLNHETHPRKI